MSDPAVTRSATVTRGPSAPDGTFGTYASDRGLRLCTLELPWLDNEVDRSCVPAGRYLCTFRWSQAHGKNVYHLENVPGRTNCEVHSANVDEQLLGCMAVGLGAAPFPEGSIAPGMPSRDVHGVTQSVEAIAQLERDMRDEEGEQQPFWLTIR